MQQQQLLLYEKCYVFSFLKVIIMYIIKVCICFAEYNTLCIDLIVKSITKYTLSGNHDMNIYIIVMDIYLLGI